VNEVLKALVAELRTSTARMDKRVKACSKVGRHGPKAAAELTKAVVAVRKALALDLLAFIGEGDGAGD